MREHGPPGVFIDLTDITVSTDSVDLSETFIEINNGLRGNIIVLQALDEGLGVVVAAAGGGSSGHGSLPAGLLGHIEVEDRLGLADILLEVNGLVECSWEAVNQVVLTDKWF